MEKSDEKIMYFIGVSTQQSIINKIFPKWMEILGFRVQLRGIDIPLNASAGIYRDYAREIKESPNVLGALVTTHKIAMYSYANDIFDVLSDSAREFKEIGAIYKRNGKMNGEATDIISVNNAFRNIFDKVGNNKDSDICILGCGGAGIALGYTILKVYNTYFNKVIMTDINLDRLDQAKRILLTYDNQNKLKFVYVKSIQDSDNVVNNLSSKSFVVNATGVGKDVDGSPVSDNVQFPYGGCVWEYNYRGNLKYMQIATEQAVEKQLSIYDGFEYFVYGWTTVISRVLNIDIARSNFDILANIALDSIHEIRGKQ